MRLHAEGRLIAPGMHEDMPDGRLPPLNGQRAAVVGAGIAGLTAAIALRSIGYRITLIEQAPAITEIGAGLQLSPNATRILARLGLTDQLQPSWREPDEIVLRSGRTTRAIARVPAGQSARRRWGAPYAVIHRADLQAALLSEATALDGIVLETGARIEADSKEQLASRLNEPDLVVGADGVWSSIRHLVPGTQDAHFAGEIAWRMTADPTSASAVCDPEQLTALLGPGAHLVAYPLKARGTVNLVAITKGEAIGTGWNGASADIRRELSGAFRGWSDRVNRLLETAEPMGRYPVYQLGDGPWHDGDRTVLIGDAAHAMPPYAAQGAAMAIEDAFALAHCLSAAETSQAIGKALDAFETIRRPRIARVRKRAAFNRFAYHARGPFRLGRDALLALRKPDSLAADFDWLYGDRSLG